MVDIPQIKFIMNEEQLNLVVDVYKEFMMKPAPEQSGQEPSAKKESTAVVSSIGVQLGVLSMSFWRKGDITEVILPPVLPEEKLSEPKLLIDKEAFIKYVFS